MCSDRVPDLAGGNQNSSATDGGQSNFTIVVTVIQFNYRCSTELDFLPTQSNSI